MIEIGNDERLHKRKKKTIRIPHSFWVRAHEKLRTVRPVA